MHEQMTSWLASQTWPDLEDRVSSDRSRIAYVHPYGFTVIRLPETRFLGWQIRVHLWPTRDGGRLYRTDVGTSGQEVHSHGWEIVSRVTVGTLEENTFALGPGGGNLYSVESDSGVGSSALRISSAGVDAVQISSQKRTESDGLYYIEAGRFHSTESASGISASVVATSATRGGSSFVWSQSEIESSMNPRLEVPDLEAILADYSRAYDQIHVKEDRWASFVFLLNSEGKCLLVRPSRSPEIWQPIGGRSDSRDANELETLIRETTEETGVRLDPGNVEYLGSSTRDIGRGVVRFWKSRVGDIPLSLQYGEILEAQWFDTSDALKLQLYAATRSALSALDSSEAK